MAAEILRLEKPIEDLAELLHGVGLTLCYSVQPIEGGQVWEIKAKNGAVDWGVGVGNNRADALASLLLAQGVELTVDDPDNPNARWGRPHRGYDNRVVLEHIGWVYVSEIRGWRHA